ncbi:adenylate kinase [Nocardioides sp. MJB4]|uniref:Adenylate kinase n=1 Tax=Nocardioides donggukensis TaxID=2774019 RepID=A0A927K1N1_9ACTN|nr:adenylate kinase [Nocardioides donggukensis]
MRRVVVYGVTGAGKTTVAAEIAARTGLPLIRVDELSWGPGWRLLPAAEQRARFGPILDGDRWVLDTAYGSWLDLALARADLVVGLDLSRPRTFARLVRRSVRRVATGERVCNGNTETLGRLLGRDSILLWHCRSFSRKRGRLRAWERDGAPRTVLLRRPDDVRAWLGELSGD